MNEIARVGVDLAKRVICWVPCDHVPVRSWSLFKARGVLRELIRTLKAEQSVVKAA